MNVKLQPVSDKMIRSRERVRDLAEVFTADREVNAMLDLVGDSTHKVETTFLEPSCGNGNFLVRILDRKMATIFSRHRRAPDAERALITALSSIYAVDICEGNVAEARERMRLLVTDAWSGNMNTRRMSPAFIAAAAAILDANVVVGDFLHGRHRIDMIEYVSLGTGKMLLRRFRLSDPKSSFGAVPVNRMEEIPAAIGKILGEPVIRSVT